MSRSIFGPLPILNAENAISYMRQEGVNNWRVERPVGIATFRQKLRREIDDPEKRRRILGLLSVFAPKTKVYRVRDRDNNDGFRVVCQGVEYGSGLIIVQQRYVMVVGEARFGMPLVDGKPAITLGPPAGVARKGEAITACIVREMQEETGCSMSVAISLTQKAIPICGARHGITCRPFLAFIDQYEPCDLRPDRGEIVRPALLTFREWWKMLQQGDVVEETAYITTLLAAAHCPALRRAIRL